MENPRDETTNRICRTCLSAEGTVGLFSVCEDFEGYTLADLLRICCDINVSTRRSIEFALKLVAAAWQQTRLHKSFFLFACWMRKFLRAMTLDSKFLCCLAVLCVCLGTTSILPTLAAIDFLLFRRVVCDSPDFSLYNIGVLFYRLECNAIKRRLRLCSIVVVATAADDFLFIVMHVRPRWSRYVSLANRGRAHLKF